ncbi:recombination-associated protein RdgC [Alcanivorax jadensis]|mgnify:CR=1 FL=1|uniref:recombination-associated protein RdgC n=1 Tax=Alcanivorax jadensis TaxID=64988 RepID=UPI0023533775|nr:recombination-associated protein RdgC [Alcanivorax jadensis]
MWIKNLIVFVGDKDLALSPSSIYAISASSLDEVLAENQCQPCGSQTMRTEGFVPPVKGRDEMVYQVNGFIFFTHQETARLLPSPVIKEMLDEKVEQIQQEEGRKVGRKEKADLKEQIIFELMPRAFTRSRRTSVLIDTEKGRVMVDSASANRAEEVVACLRKAIGSLPVAYPAPDAAPYTSFSNWLRDTKLLPEGFTLGDRCELKGTKDEGASLKCISVDLGQEEYLAHLDTGMVATRVNLAFHDHLELDVNDKLEIKRIKALDLLQENIDAMDADDEVEELQAQIALQGSVLRDAINVLFTHFGVNQ